MVSENQIRTLGLHEDVEAWQYREFNGSQERQGTGSRTTRADSSIVTMEETQLPRGRVAMRVAMAVLAVLLVCQAISPKARGLDERCGLFL